MASTENKKEWFESEDFWTNYGPIIFDDAHWKEAPAVADFVIELADLKPGSKVLDCGCGVGRISVELAAAGMQVTGIDIIQNELDCAKQSAEDEGVELELIKADLRTFTTPKKYDCSINLYTSFGYCDTVEEDMEILKNMTAPVKEGGTFILECVSRETAIINFTEGEWFERAGWTVLTEFEPVGAWEGLRSKWILLGKDGTRIEHEFIQRLYTAVDLKNELLKLGFKTVEVCSDFDHSPYDQNSRIMVLIAKK